MPGLMARLRGQTDPLDSDLKKITESGVVDVPQELFAFVMESTHDADARRKIMTHLRSCLSDAAPKRWRRVYCALLLTEKLLENGSPVLMIETAHGHHFDLLQKVSFLEHFQCEAEKHSQHMVRKKAAALRSILAPRLQESGEEELPLDAGLTILDTVSCGTEDSSASTKSGSISSNTASSLASSASAASNNSEARSTESQPGLLARGIAHIRGSGSPLLKNLKSITESAVIDIPKDLLNPIFVDSHNVDSRKVIMQHLHECLTEPSGAKWRRVYAGLLLLEGLVQHGSSAIVSESSHGLHFDILQQLSFLEKFEYSVDGRAQNLVRRRAAALLKMISAKVDNVSADEIIQDDESDDKSEASTRLSQSTGSTAIATGNVKSIACDDLDLLEEFAAKSEEPRSQLILNGIVTVGHNDDTTSESSGIDVALAVRRRDLEQRTLKTKAQRKQTPAAPVEMVAEMLPAMQANTVDLLDF